MTSRGCPYKCRFCSTTQFWKTIRFHSPEYVGQLISNLKRKGCTHVQIWDDLFTMNMKRLRDIAPLMKQSGMKYNCQPRTDMITPEVCQLLKSAGVTTCIFGFESGNNRTLKYVKRGTTTVQINTDAINMCHDAGLKVQGSCMVGVPGETYEEMLQTVRFIDVCLIKGVQRIWTFVATPFPGTEFWEIFKRKGEVRIKWEELSHYSEPLLSTDPEGVRKIMKQIKWRDRKFQWRKLWKLITK